MISPDSEFINILAPGAAGSETVPTKPGGKSLPEVMPILGLSDIVVFPGMVAPLLVESAQSIRLIDDVVAGDRFLGLVLQRRAEPARARQAAERPAQVSWRVDARKLAVRARTCPGLASNTRVTYATVSGTKALTLSKSSTTDSYAGQTVLITGAARGSGANTARRLHAGGANVSVDSSFQRVPSGVSTHSSGVAARSMAWFMKSTASSRCHKYSAQDPVYFSWPHSAARRTC